MQKWEGGCRLTELNDARLDLIMKGHNFYFRIGTYSICTYIIRFYKNKFLCSGNILLLFVSFFNFDDVEGQGRKSCSHTRLIGDR